MLNHKSKGAEILENVHPTKMCQMLHVMWNISCVTCQVPGVTCHVSQFFLITLVVQTFIIYCSFDVIPCSYHIISLFFISEMMGAGGFLCGLCKFD